MGEAIMRLPLIVGLLLSVQSASLADRASSPECRAIYLDDVEYCSVSFYEILSDTRRYSNMNIRITGYLRYELGDAYLSPDLASISGPILADNVIALANDGEFEDAYKKSDGVRIEIFGTFRHPSTTQTMVRGRISPVVHIEPR